MQFVREGRAFEDDEIAMTAELIAKAELAAAEILALMTASASRRSMTR